MHLFLTVPVIPLLFNLFTLGVRVTDEVLSIYSPIFRIPGDITLWKVVWRKVISWSFSICNLEFIESHIYQRSKIVFYFFHFYLSVILLTRGFPYDHCRHVQTFSLGDCPPPGPSPTHMGTPLPWTCSKLFTV